MNLNEELVKQAGADVLEVCTGRYGTQRVREGTERGQDGFVGLSGSCATVGMAEEEHLE